MPILGILTLREFIRKYGLSPKQETELITMQAFHQAVAMLIGAGTVIVLQVIWSFVFPG